MDSQPNSASLDQLQDVQTSLANDIIFVDTGLADYQTLVHGLPDSAQVVLLDAHQDGLTQMAAYLEGKNGINAIHVLSHGAAGRLRLGDLTLDAASLDTHAAELAAIGRGLAPDGDILLYGCNVAAGQTGVEFIGRLAEATGADVAASDDLTGAAGKGGDWVLENNEGQVTVQPLFSDLYNTILASPVSENFDSVTLTQGPGGVPGTQYSFGNPEESRTINGWTFSVLNASGGLATGCQIDVTNNTQDTQLVNDNDDKAAFFSGTATDADALSLKSASGDSFSFQSLYVQWGLSGTANYRLVGYLDNGAVASATHDFTAPNFYNPGLKVEVSGTQWNNIDEIRIFILSGTDDASLYIDDIVVSAPPDTTPPTLDGASSTPADNATGVGVNANLLIDFSENIAFGSSGSIVLRNVTGNSTVETFNAASASGGSVTGSNGSTATISGDKMTINPTNNLAGNTQYSVQFSTGSIVDTDSPAKTHGHATHGHRPKWSKMDRRR